MAPLRLIRAALQQDPAERMRQARSFRQHATADRILAAAETILDQFGRASLTFAALAQGLGLSPRTIRTLFADVETILSDLISRHIEAVTNVVAAIPSSQPGHEIARRHAYRAATRTPFGAPTAQHILLLRQLHTLPDDLRDPLDLARRSLGILLAPQDPDLVLTLLDQTELTPDQIGATLALAAAPPASEPAPAATSQEATAPPEDAGAAPAPPARNQPSSAQPKPKAKGAPPLWKPRWGPRPQTPSYKGTG